MSRFSVRTELRLGGTWVDISKDVYQRDEVQIVRGRPDEGSRTDPGECTLTLNNRAGKYSPRNPVGPYYGMIGRNTPLRVWAGTPTVGATTYDDSVTSTSHVAPSVTARAGDSVLIGAWIASQFFETPGDYTVPAGMTSSGEVTGAYSTMVTATEALTATGATGTRTATYSKDASGFVAANIAVPGDTGTPVVEEMQSDVAENASITFRTGAGTQEGWLLLAIHAWNFDGDTEGSVDMAAPSGTPGQWTPVADSERRTTGAPHLRAWVRRVGVAGPQEVTFNADPNDTLYNNHARLYVLSSAEIASLRFAGEVSAWPPRWDASDTDVYVPVTASGVLRRLGQGNKALQSAIYRESLAPNKRPPRAYWPCEDNRDASLIASGLDNGLPMDIVGAPELSTFDGFAASDDLPLMKTGSFEGSLAGYAGTGETQIRWLMRVPGGNDAPPGEEPIIQFTTSGTAQRWQIRYEDNGAISVRVFDAGGSVIYNSGAVLFDVNEKLLRGALELTETGGNVDYDLAFIEPGATSGPQFGETIANNSLGTVQSVQINRGGQLGDTAIGHISIHDEITSIFDLGDALNAWRGEPAGERLQRLCREENITFEHTGNLGTTQWMGWQNIDSLLNLLRACAEADGGILHETRHQIGLSYRTRQSMYNQGQS